MAKSVLVRDSIIGTHANGTEMEIGLEVIFCDDSTIPPFVFQTSFPVRFATGATPLEIRTAISDAVKEWASDSFNLDPPWTNILGNDIVITFTPQRGI
jgi:hypothetical protein